MLNIGKIATGGGFVTADAPIGSAAGFSPPVTDWFDRAQRLNRMVGGLKWTSSSWDMATELDRVRADLPPARKPTDAKDQQLSDMGLVGVASMVVVDVVLMFCSIGAAMAKSVTIINIPDDSFHLKDRETRS